MEMRKISRIHYSTVMWFLNLSEPPHDTTVSGIQRNIVDAYNNVASQSKVPGMKIRYMTSLFHVMEHGKKEAIILLNVIVTI